MEPLDPNSVTYHVQIERLKRLITESIKEAGIDPNLLAEEDILNIIDYVDSLCVTISEMTDSVGADEMPKLQGLTVGYLIKAVIANAAAVLILQKNNP